MSEVLNLNNIIGVLINSFGYIYIWSKLESKKINFKSFKYYIIHILFAASMMCIHLLISDMIRILLLVLLMVIFCNILFKNSIKNSTLSSFFSQIIMMISELLFAFILTFILRVDVNLLLTSYSLTLFTNIAITIFAILIVKIKYVKKLYDLSLKLISNLNKYNIIIIMAVILISINFMFASVYYYIDLQITLTINTIISIVYLIICFKFLSAQNKFNNINTKYNTTLNSLKEYEDILDAYRVSNHENKNQLLTVRSMIVNKEKGIPEYIDKIIDNKIKDDEKLMFDTNTIPAGGLRAVIYSKMLFMKDNKIDFNLKVGRKVRTVDLIELGDELTLDVCKIVGVFLDNSIEAVNDLKDKNIDINLHADDRYLYIEISNNFEGKIDLSKIDSTGYTSKSGSHGYGLSLVKEIISKNSNLTNERKISKNIFTQQLKIKLK